MNLLLVRHGKAEPAGINLKDFDRKLTTQGEEILLKATEIWKKFIDPPDEIISSPYLRAFQTGEIIADAFNFKKEIITDTILSPGCSTSEIIEIANAFEKENIMFIGHQPDLSKHTSNLVAEKFANISFSPGTVAKINFESRINFSRGVLEFLIPPKK